MIRSVSGVPELVAGTQQLVARFQGVDSGRTWFVRRLVVSCDNAATGRALAYTVPDGGVIGDRSCLSDGTNSGAFDISEYVQLLEIPGGMSLAILWENTAAGSALARIEFDEVVN